MRQSRYVSFCLLALLALGCKSKKPDGQDDAGVDGGTAADGSGIQDSGPPADGGTVQDSSPTADAATDAADAADATVSCGDGVQQAPEACDDGAFNTDTECVPDFGGCTYCTTACQVETRGVVLEVGIPEGYGAGRWTDKVINDGAEVHTGSGGPCFEEPSLGAYNACLHAGELRWFEAPGHASCAGLHAVDALDAFNWRCVERQVKGSTEAWLLSTGLKDDRHLSHLIDFTGMGWLPNALTISDGTGVVHVSASERWWVNTFAAAAVDVGTTTVLNQPFEVNVVRQNGAQEFDMAGDHTILVVQPGMIVSNPGVGTEQISLFGPDSWLEGEFEGGGLGPRPIHAVGTRHTLRNYTVRNFGRGARLEGKNGRYEFVRAATTSGPGRGPSLDFAAELSLIRHLYVADSVTQGISINGFHGNIAAHLFVVGSHGDGMSISSPGLTLVDLVSISNDGAGLATNSRNQLAVNATLALNDDDGFQVNSCDGCTLARIASTTNAGDGYVIGSSTQGAQFVDANSQANSRVGFRLQGSGNIFRGQMAWGHNMIFPNDPLNTCGGTCEACECESGSGVPGPPFWGLLEGVDAGGEANACVLDTDPANAPPRIDDQRVANYGHTVGKIQLNMTLPRDQIVDILDVPHRYVGWGSGGCLAQPACDGMGPCPAAGTVACICDPLDVGCVDSVVVCQLYDLRLIDIGLRQPLHPTGDDVIRHVFANNASLDFCDMNYPGSVHDATSNTCTTTFLDHAIELVGDLLGNENYLCESGETCIYTPYRAAYMGEGDLVPARICSGGGSCAPVVWQDGAITGVTLLQYESLTARDPGGTKIDFHAP